MAGLRSMLNRVMRKRPEQPPDDYCELFAPGAMVAHLRGTLASSRYRPPLLPTVAAQLLSLTRDPNATLGAAREILERDPVLAAKVLQLGQSALYGGPHVRSLEQAVVRLGLDTLSDVLLETVASSRIFTADGYSEPMQRLLMHSTVTAHVSRLVCARAGIPEDSAFTCGLLHDAGTAIGVLIFSDPTVTRWGARRLPSFEQLANALEAVHDEASGVLARAWSLSSEVTSVVSNHHRPGSDPLSAAICVADWVASEAGAPFDETLDDAGVEDAVRSLGLGDGVLSELKAQGIRILESL